MSSSIFLTKRVVSVVAFVLGLVSLYMMFIYAPTEKYMGDMQRIMYVHVPSAWMAYFSFVIMAIAGALFLWKKALIWDHVAHTAAELGIFFMSLVLITGSLWGRPVWNAWWVWDPRLTTALILWFALLGYLLLRASHMEIHFKRKVAAIYGIIGLVNVPLVHYSVEWWRSIHPIVITHHEINMPPEMIYTLFTSAIFFLVFFGLLLLYRFSIHQYRDQVAQLKEQISRVRR
jgi:heme exporter protein C